MHKLKAQIPNLLTAGNLVAGVVAIIFALTGKLQYAPYCIFIGAFFDFFDGFAARLLKVKSELGKQLDSLADMVTFGVAPGIIVFQWLKVALLNEYTGGLVNESSFWALYGASSIDKVIAHGPYAQILETGISPAPSIYFWLPFVALLIPVMSMFRLAKFNLDTRQTDSFIGVPTPANTLFFASFPLIFQQNLIPEDALRTAILDAVILNPWVVILLVGLMSFLLVAELPLFALKFKTFGWNGNQIRYIFLTLAVILLATLHWLALPLIIILYILLSVIQNFRKQ